MEFDEWYRDFITRVTELKTAEPKFSFKFLEIITHKATSLRNDEDPLMTKWNDTIERLNTLKIEVIKVHEQLHREATYNLVETKKDIVKWIQDDMKMLNQINVEYITQQDAPSRKVKVFDEYIDDSYQICYKKKNFVLTGKAREEAEYRLYINNSYLSKILDYFDMFIQLDMSIERHMDATPMNDQRILIIQEWWNPQ
jgi:hypothetical protein